MKLLDLSFINATRPKYDKCESGMKICGTGTDNDQQVCVPESTL